MFSSLDHHPYAIVESQLSPSLPICSIGSIACNFCMRIVVIFVDSTSLIFLRLTYKSHIISFLIQGIQARRIGLGSIRSVEEVAAFACPSSLKVGQAISRVIGLVGQKGGKVTTKFQRV